ncbi:hypothetical protein AN216_00170, partial [Streptomyces oceani]
MADVGWLVMAIRTELVDASSLLVLRREVLRPGRPLEAARFGGDELPGAFHVAAYEADPGAVSRGPQPTGPTESAGS